MSLPQPTRGPSPGGRPVQGDVLRAVLEDLSGSFSGQLLTPDAKEYDESRRIWNAMIDARPGLIARCATTADVAAVVRAAGRHDVLLSVRGGGHGVAGKSMCDGGVTIDLGLMRGVEVDPARQLVHAQGGCLLGDIDAATAPHGLAAPVGIVSETGVAGLALGGGIGWLSRKHGLTCDNFVSLEVVTAAGDVLEVSDDAHPDLFWALRGGGGNFGVVTRFTLRAHRFGPEFRIGVALYEPDAAAEALREYARLAPDLPDWVGWHAALKREMPELPFVPPELAGRQLLMLVCMWLGDADDPEGVELVERLTSVGRPVTRTATTLPFGLGIQRSMDHEFPNGHRYYTKEAHVPALSEELMGVLLDFWNRDLCGPSSSMGGEVEIIALGGAMARVPEEASAFANRGSPWWLNFAILWDDEADDEGNIAKIRAAHQRLRPWLGRGVYVNMLNLDELDQVVDAYGGVDSYRRLGAVKARYDPNNLFRVNHNIRPAPAAAEEGR